MKPHAKMDKEKLMECRKCEKWVHKGTKMKNIDATILKYRNMDNVNVPDMKLHLSLICSLREKAPTKEYVWIHVRSMRCQLPEEEQSPVLR